VRAEADLAFVLFQMLLRRGACRSRARRRDKPNGSVCKDAIDVEEDDFDAAGAILRGQSHDAILTAVSNCGAERGNPRQ
jgi:hypothetical protein